MILHINKLSKKYSTLDGNVVALDDVSFKVERGEVIAIVGKSGSGKTTLLNMIGGLDIPDSGSILFEGIDIVKLSDKNTAKLRRKKIGVIYQFYNLIPELNISENITLPAELDGEDVNREWLSEILTIVGLRGREQAYPSALSGGQQQRVAIARALFNKPILILADEPTGNLDGENSSEVLRLFKQMNEELGVTIIVVTHSDIVASETKRIITISNGKVTGDRRNE